MGRTLYKNSLYLMINSAVLAFSGFLFWLLVARIYSPQEIGIATTLFSAILMISGISTLGLNAGLLRYIPTAKSFQKRFNSSIILTILAASILASIYIIILPMISQDLVFIRTNIFIILAFISFTIISGISELLESVFLALKKTSHILQKNITFSLLKLFLPFFLISFGAFGIVTTIFVSLAIAVLLGFAILYKKTSYRFQLQFSKNDINDMTTYSFGSFVSAQVSNIPMYILPILITAKLSVVQTAYYFIAASIASFLFFIPKVVTQNLLVEGAHDEKNLRSHIFHSAVIIFSLFVPLGIGVIFFGQNILTLFGKSYTQEGFTLLQLLTIAAFFGCINTMYATLFAIKKNVRLLILTNVIYSGVLLTYVLFSLSKGIISIGYASIAAQLVVLVVNFILVKFRKI